MGGFSNAIVGGAQKLIRAAIQSPNYLTGVAGWIIRKDGTAEFNGITIRGTIVLIPVAAGVSSGYIKWVDGNAISPRIFEDLFNLLTISGAGDGTISANDEGLFFIGKWTSTTGAMGMQANVASDNGLQFDIGTPGHHGFQMQNTGPAGANSVNMGRSGGKVATTPGAVLQLGPGASGKYYFEEVSRSGLLIANNTIVGLTGLTQTHIASDYGSQWNLATGQWTCPETGPYKIQFDINYLAGFGAAGRHFVLISDNTSGVRLACFDANVAGSTSDGTTSFYGNIVQGDVLTFIVLQGSGGNLTTGIATRISIGRDL